MPSVLQTRRIHQLHAPLPFAGGLVRHHDGGAALVLDAQIDTARRLARLVAFEGVVHRHRTGLGRGADRGVGPRLRQGDPGRIAVHARLGVVEGLEAQGQGRRAGLHPEVAVGGIREQRIGDDGARFMSGLLPFGQGLAHELDGRAGAVEPAVAAAHRLGLAPGAGQGRTRLPHDDVALEA
jgi:hypothetical protein